MIGIITDAQEYTVESMGLSNKYEQFHTISHYSALLHTHRDNW